MENISRTFTIYKLTSPSNKIYIGFTSMGLKARYDKHKSNFKRWLKSNKQIPGCTKLFNAFQKYGFDVWDKEILFETQNEQEAFAKEVELIELYDAITTGYNILRGGDKGRLGLTSTDEHKQKI